MSARRASATFTFILLAGLAPPAAAQPLAQIVRTDFLAEGVDWRTPALWGIGLAKVVSPMVTFLHDGRAQTLEEAILWHGGEGTAAREAFRMATHAERAALIAFLDTL